MPLTGKANLEAERALKTARILTRLGGPSRVVRTVAGEDVGSLEILTRYPDMKTATDVYVALYEDKEAQQLRDEREQNPSATVTGPILYRGVYGEASALKVLVQREYHIPREHLADAIQLLPEAHEAAGHAPMFAVVPVFAPNMERLVLNYYSESLQAMGSMVDKHGMSERFQAVVRKASQYGHLIRARVLEQV